jgi:antitoxin PrlF
LIRLKVDFGKEFPYFSVMITSKLTAKAQTTIPQAVRVALHVKEGDELAYVIEGDHVVLRKAKSELRDDPFATFDEWASEADAKAYATL